jgi:ferrous iron transport protein B
MNAASTTNIQTEAKTIALVGNPNCGKTTLFNTLTGARQRVGNWPGVTVERKSSDYKHADTEYQVIDLSGTYSIGSDPRTNKEGLPAAIQ